jgi:hypothetical protein
VAHLLAVNRARITKDVRGSRVRDVTRWRGALLAAVVMFCILAGSGMADAGARSDLSPNGQNYARLRNGATRHAVLSLLGRNFGVCSSCAPVTWIYKLGIGDPIAIVVRFKDGKVASHFLVRPQSDV